MNPTEEQAPARRSFISPEARIGTGITIAMIGLLFLMLGWAQYMREVKETAVILLPLGAILLIVGVLVASMARSGRPR